MHRLAEWKSWGPGSADVRRNGARTVERFGRRRAPAGTLADNDVYVDASSYAGLGGGAFVAGAARFEASLFSGNRGDGGAAYVRGADVSQTGSRRTPAAATWTFRGDEHHTRYAPGTLELADCVVTGNEATWGWGAGVLIPLGGTLDMVGCDVTNNAGSYGSGVQVNGVASISRSRAGAASHRPAFPVSSKRTTANAAKSIGNGLRLAESRVAQVRLLRKRGGAAPRPLALSGRRGRRQLANIPDGGRRPRGQRLRRRTGVRQAKRLGPRVRQRLCEFIRVGARLVGGLVRRLRGVAAGVGGVAPVCACVVLAKTVALTY